tara:strand:+ start:4221 stop:4448 length:228 start_codon:yes stop_codon:yes gene_type:complete
MDGDQLTKEQVSVLSGESIHTITSAIRRGDLLDLSVSSVGEWLKSLLHVKIERELKKKRFSATRSPNIHHKWDRG